MSEHAAPRDARPRPRPRLELDARATRPRVGIIMGSQVRHGRDGEGRRGARGRRDRATRSASCRPTATPTTVAEYCKNARMRGLRVIIAGAGLSAALPGVAAAHTDLPVIGVPLTSRLSAAGGLDAILSVVQMPPGVPGRRRRPGQPAQRGAPGDADPQRSARRSSSPGWRSATPGCVTSGLSMCRRRPISVPH